LSRTETPPASNGVSNGNGHGNGNGNGALPANGASMLAEIKRSLGPRPVRDLSTTRLQAISPLRRMIDILVAGSLCVLLSPLLLLTALAIKLTSHGPVLFVQQRAGLNGKPFPFLKFRSMYVNADAHKKDLAASNEQSGPIFKIKNDPRKTPLGRFLRKTSVDELPQLWNVLRGDMTLVGPRPPTLDAVEEYEPWQRERLSVVGGLTCIWQVSGRSEIGFEDWVRMDIQYAERRTPLLDLSLLLRTAKAVATGRGAY
jgi:lipopolysaccharide/colanic/teichoic acid biosynthesis glycosyltransferase